MRKCVTAITVTIITQQSDSKLSIVTEDEFNHSLELIEVKRQAKNLDLAILRAKTEVFLNATGISGYHIETRGLSMDDI